MLKYYDLFFYTKMVHPGMDEEKQKKKKNKLKDGDIYF